MSVAIIIPSRIGSTRLTRKSLSDINGKPMVVHTLNRALEAKIGDVFVATDDDDIKNVVEKANGKAIMTDPELPSGTDRMYVAYKQLSNKYNIIVNLQGDMPNVKSYIIKETIELLKNSDADITTAVGKIFDRSEITNINVVKAILSIREGQDWANALYFTRSSAPANPTNDENADFYHHLGIYAYKSSALEKFVSLPQTYLEKREKLEQLRALENGMKIYAKIIKDIPVSVDTIEDLERIRSIMS